MEKAQLTEYLVIAAYLIFMVITGFIFRKFVKNFSDYFRSGCRCTWWLVGTSVFMCSFSAWSFTGAAGVAYQSGISVAVIFLANALGYLVNFLITAPLFRQMRAITFPEVIRERFDVSTQQFYVWLGVLPGILMAGLTLWGVAVFTSAIFGFNVQNVIIVVGVVVLIYSTVGGSWSVMATDFLQALLLMPLAILITFLSLKSIGGIGGLVNEINAQNLQGMLSFVDPEPGSQFTVGWALAMLLFVMLAYNSMGSAVKYFSCKDGRDARKAAALACILMFIGAIMWFIPPVVARLQYSSIVDAQNISVPAEASYAVISLKLLPHGFAGLIVVAMFSASMSSISAQLNQFAAIITQDFYKPFIRPKSSQKEIFIVGQITSFITGALITGAALYLSGKTGKGLFDYMLEFGALFGTPTIVPMFLVLFIKKAPKWSAVFSICCSFVFSYLGWKNGWSYEGKVFSIVITGTIAFIVTIPFWKYSPAEYKERVINFYKKMHTKVDFEKEVGNASDSRQLKLVGYVTFSIGFFTSLTLFIPNSLGDRMSILFVAGSILFFAFLMLYVGYKRDKKQNK